jgi:exonuclease SbcC
VAARVAALTAAADRRQAAADALGAQVRAAREAARAATRADAAARAHGFADARSARAAVRAPEHSETLAREVQAFDAGLAQRRALAGDPDLAAAAAAPEPDLPGLEDAWERADVAASAAEAAARPGRSARARAPGARRPGEAALEVLGPRAERRRAVRDLARLADGSAEANVLRMRLSAYVLAARLEEVAAAATVRLEAMSAAATRWSTATRAPAGRRRGGLDLRVVDGWTGQERAPATLSGGETFFASLALALGLADVVAQEAGGARLETLFVDEGFGSLDERTLEHVLEVLDRLRDGGRTVGIVSHVADLRDRIPAQLRVIKERTGSRVEHLTPA